MLNDALDKHRQGDLAGAEEIYQEALKTEPDNHEVLHLYALLKQDQGKLEEATTMLARAIELRPEAASFHASMGGLLQLGGDQEGARVSLMKALELNSNLVQAHIALGYLQMVKGNFTDSRQCFETALRIEPDSLPATLNMANLYLLEGNADKAVAFAQQAVDMQPQQAVAQTTLGRAFAAQGHPAFAEQCFRNALNSREDYAAAKVELARVLTDTNQLDEAVTLLQAVLTSDRDNVAALDALGDLAFKKEGFSQAVQNYQFALTLDRSRADILAKLGQAYLAMGDSANALRCLDGALSQGFESPAVHVGRGDALARTGDRQEALAAYEPALVADPMEPGAWAGYGRLMVELQQGYTALERLTERCSEAQSSGAISTLCGRLSLVTGRPAEAAEHLISALQQEDTPADEAGALLGRAYHVLEQHELAAVAFSDAAEAGGRSFDPLENNKRIAGLSSTVVESEHAAPTFLIGSPESGLGAWISTLSRSNLLQVLSDRLRAQDHRQDFLTQPESFVSLNEIPEATIRLHRRRYWRSLERSFEQSNKLIIDIVPLSLNAVRLIRHVFPEARIVLLQRDARDVALQALANRYPVSQARALATAHLTLANLINESALNCLPVQLPESEHRNSTLGKLWAHLGIPDDAQNGPPPVEQSWHPANLLEDGSWSHYCDYLGELFKGLEQPIG